MTFHWRKVASVLPLSGALTMLACSGTLDDPYRDGDASSDSSADELVADENGVILGTSWQALSYPTCMSAASDPDGDGWGWEFNRSCIVNTAAGSAYPACMSAASDPDGDGWGREFNRLCAVKSSSGEGSSTGGSSGASSGSGGSSVCANLEGTASTMAALAVSAAMEIGRWQPLQDFTIGRQGTDEALILTAGAKARCADRTCFNTQALLDFQKNEANGKVEFPGNVTLNSPALRSRLVAKFRDQASCEMQPSNGGTTNCPAEEHTLTFQRSEKGGCDTNFFFVARKPDGQPLLYPAQLKNKLLWADRTNPYIGFQSVGEVVSIDPTFGLNERGSTTTGTCSAACVKIGSPDLEGDCCSCRGENRSYVRSAWNTRTFICQ
jgi:hypothetical protein